MSRETIARTLKRLRERSGLTADQVGNLVGKSGKTVNAWENNRGQPDADVLIQLCDIYDVDNILLEFREDASKGVFSLSEGEKRLVEAYRNNPDMQKSVDRLLGIDEDVCITKKAARNGDNGFVSLSSDQVEEIVNSPDVGEDA